MATKPATFGVPRLVLSSQPGVAPCSPFPPSVTSVKRGGVLGVPPPTVNPLAPYALQPLVRSSPDWAATSGTAEDGHWGRRARLHDAGDRLLPGRRRGVYGEAPEADEFRLGDPGTHAGALGVR